MHKLIKITVATIAICLAALQAKAASTTDAITNRALKRHITRYALQYHVEREVLSCVLYVESGYKVNTISNTEDYGSAQINIKTIKMYNLSVVELLTNGEYNVRAAAEILGDYRRVFKAAEINDWPARYNIGYQSLRSGSIGALYMQYNKKVRSCISGGLGL